MKTNRANIALILGILVIAVVSYAIYARRAPDGSGDDRNTNAASGLPAGWLETKDAESGLSFGYPPSLTETYMRFVDWPPDLQYADEPFSCTEAGEPSARAGETSRKTIGGREYCVTRIVEGAAGTVYTQYAYAFPREDKTAILTFSIAASNCGNYPEPQMAECERERSAFSIDPTIDAVARSIR